MAAALTCPSCGTPVSERLTLTYEETWTVMGISRKVFFELKAKGVFRGLETAIPHRFSREKVEAFCANRPLRPYAASGRF